MLGSVGRALQWHAMEATLLDEQCQPITSAARSQQASATARLGAWWAARESVGITRGRFLSHALRLPSSRPVDKPGVSPRAERRATPDYLSAPRWSLDTTTLTVDSKPIS